MDTDNNKQSNQNNLDEPVDEAVSTQEVIEQTPKEEATVSEEVGVSESQANNEVLVSEVEGATTEEAFDKAEDEGGAASADQSLFEQGESDEGAQSSTKSDEPVSDEVGDASLTGENGATESTQEAEEQPQEDTPQPAPAEPTPGKWYVVHTFAGHENKVAQALRQRIEAEHLESKIFDILVPTQDKIEIRGGKKETVKEKIFPGYILVKMELDDVSWLAVRTTPGVTSFVGMSNKPTPVSEAEIASIVKFTTQGAAPTFKDVFMIDDTVKIIDGPFAEFIGKVESVDKEKGRVRVLVSIFGRETPVELDFLQVTKL